MSKKIDTGKKILSLLDKLTDKKVKESKKNTIDSERVAEALEEKLIDDPYYLEDMEPEEYQDLMDSLPPKLQDRFSNLDFADDMYESQSFKVESLDPKEAAGSMELFQGGDEVRSYIQNLNAGQQRQFVDALSTEDRDFYKTILEDEIDFGPREPKNVGGSMLMPSKRKAYGKGDLVKKIINKVSGKKNNNDDTPEAIDPDFSIVIKKAPPKVPKKLTPRQQEEAEYRAFEKENKQYLKAQALIHKDEQRGISRWSFEKGPEVLRRSYMPKGSTKFNYAFKKAWMNEDKFFKVEGEVYNVDELIEKSKYENKAEGGSMLMPPERENYRVGRLAKKIKNVGSDILEEANKHVNDLRNEATPDQKKIAPVTKSQRATRDTGRKAATATAVGATVLRIGEFVFDNINSEDIPKIVEAAKADGINVEVVDERINPSDYPVYEKGSDSAKEFRKLQKEAKQVGAAFFDYEGRSYNTMEKKNKGGMTKYAEGSLMVPPEMEEMPEDTYDNIPPEEMAEAQASQLPDDEMENKYLDFVMSEALDMEEQEYLMSVLETDARLNGIFDKVMDVAGEFSGEGEVDGPGTGVSDSIPARLSDGEFVFTRKATDQLGADQLQTMMDDAERAYDGGMMKSKMQKAFGGLTNDPMDTEKTYMDSMQNTEEEIKRQMIKANRTPSVYSNLG